MSPSRPQVRYRAICQAGILAAAICGIDLTEAWNPDAELNLEKKEKKDSVGSQSLSNTPIGNRRTSHETYRRRPDNGDFDFINSSSNSSIVNSVKPYDLSSMSDISSTATISTQITTTHSVLPYNEPYSEQDTIHFREDMYPQPTANAALARFRRKSSENQPDSRQQSKSASPIRRTSKSTDFHDSKPQRPKTLNVTPNHKVTEQANSESFPRFSVSKSTATIMHHSQPQPFTNSNTSSSSQSPVSTPSPKPLKAQIIKDVDRIDKVSSMPTRIHQYAGSNNSTRPRAQSAFNQPGVITNQTGGNMSAPKPTSDFIAFI